MTKIIVHQQHAYSSKGWDNINIMYTYWQMFCFGKLYVFIVIKEV